MENIVIGLLAHVDRGKTSLSESLLFESGQISKKGRVDHGDSHLDHDELERKKGITIYAKSVYFSRGNKRFFLLDTPGHREFSGEMERALQVLDYGILLLDAKEGIGKREKELWTLAKEAGLPLFLFVNKMDLFQGDKEEILEDLKRNFPGENILDFHLFQRDLFQDDLSRGELCQKGSFQKDSFQNDFPEKNPAQCDFLESIALSDLESTEEYLETGSLRLSTVVESIEKRQLMPLFFGSALQQEGIGAFLEALSALTVMRKAEKRKEEAGEDGTGREREEKNEEKREVKPVRDKPEKAGFIYKITHDEKGRRIAKGRLFKGSLALREEWLEGEKLTELRMEQGERYDEIFLVEPGMLFSCPVSEKVNQGYFPEEAGNKAEENGFFRLKLTIGGDDILRYAREISAIAKEFPEWKLHIDEESRTVLLNSLGNLQRELMKNIFQKRTGKEPEFSAPELVYGEGPRKEAYGRAVIESPGHYFGIFIRLSPLSYTLSENEEILQKEEIPKSEGRKAGGLLSISEKSSLKKDWISLLQNEWKDLDLRGPAFSGPFTDYRIEILEAEWTESRSYYMDLKGALWEALNMAKNNAGLRLYSPVFSYAIRTEQDTTGQVLQEIERLSGKQEELFMEEEKVLLKGKMPGESLPEFLEILQRRGIDADYHFSHFAEMEEEKEREVFIERMGDAEDWEALFYGREEAEWIEKGLLPKKKEKKEKTGEFISDIELEEIFLKTFGPIRNRGQEALLSEQKLVLSKEKEEKQREARAQYERKWSPGKKEILLVDGYNFMFAKNDLKELATEDLMAGREKVVQLLSEYAVFYDKEVYLIFDAYHVKGNQGSRKQLGKNLELIFTKEGESADFTLTKLAKDFSEKGRRVSVVTSDQAVQVQAFSGKGVSRYSSREFFVILEDMRKQILEMDLS
ncbi:NYN domain-containing protein [Oribacterium parvum]|uniref:NYN domain-containing protein n=1 Tax=Oribacterium parvum TaxID=1501329 RepID=UPI0028ED5148|nr:NYN domain-containing protein [Oribacterium parvum]